ELLGRAGNDILTQVVNSFFDAMVAVAYTWGGDVLSFGGDALLVAFTGAERTAQAAAAAAEMQRAVALLPPIPLPSRNPEYIKMKIGIASGPLVRASVGTSARHVALALGAVLHTADLMAAATKAGYVRLDPQAADEVMSSARLTPDAGSYLLDELTAFPAPAETPRRYARDMAVADLVRAILRLAPYLSHDVLAELAASPDASPGDGEQREVISVFVQFAGLNDISDALGIQRAGEIAAIATDVLAPCLDAIERAGGVLARVDTYADGHKLLALFGAPRAGERDADWAVWAALRLREQLPAISAAAIQQAREAGAQLDRLPAGLTLRAGINAGQVVTALVGSGVRYEYIVMGDSANVAARLMGMAKPAESQVLLGPRVYEQLRETIKASDLGSAMLKGKDAPTRILAAQSILPRSWRAPSSSPLVGRADELAALDAVVAALHSGRRRVVLIQGEAGVGKTRLRQALQDMLGGRVAIAMVFPPGRAAPVYGALRALLYAVCAIPLEASPDLVRAKLREMLASYGAADDALLVALELLAGAADQPFVQMGGDEAALRIAFAGLVQRLLLLIAAHGPLALFVEDLHDLDGESLAVLEQLLLLGWDAPLLLCATLRPGSGQAVAARRVCDAALERFGGDALRLEIGRLDTASGGALLDALIPGLAPNARSALLDHAGANPLFLELLAQRIEQQGALRPEPHGRGLVLRRPLNWLAIPATLRELVVAQLDTLPPAVRRTARAAAVLATAGRTFTRQLLEQIADEPSAIAARLDELKQARVIVPAPSAAESFSFRHPLFQSEAYQLLQSHERRQLHRRAAEALDTGTDADDARSEMLAYHYRQGQVWDRTQVWSLDAGTRARRAY
ncbi:MAG TPA: AAA family ATPase, partial [Roseiflexaceae bacterium]